MRRFFYDILRDKGSTKFSITKLLALVTFIFMITYLLIYLFILKIEIDHTILLELIGFDITLLGIKNNWGAKTKTSPSEKTTTMTFESVPDKQIEDEGSF